MVEVSQKFKDLSRENGRHVYCRIEAGDEVFLDDRLLEFTFDDVTHPDWFTLGTTCANRFHFKARFSGELEVGAEVRPYISFDNEEWCPLGIFYISRRYVRGDTISITAYDKMYSLDIEYRYDGILPVTSDVLLADVCAKHGIEPLELGYGYKVEKLPSLCTARDMIGYIAGINRCCAKIDRYGRLVFKECGTVDSDEMDYISLNNCIDVQRNMTKSVVTALTAETDDGILYAGSGAEISTIQIYNPLMTQEILDGIRALMKNFSFYGADIVMQGQPHLESGESIRIYGGGGYFQVMISEIEYHYNGALTATLYSRNKTYVDAVAHMDDLEEMLKSLKLSNSVFTMKSENEELITLDTNPKIIADFTFETGDDGFAELHINTSVTLSDANRIIFEIYVNGTDSGRNLIHCPDTHECPLTELYHLAQKLKKGENRLYVTARTNINGAYILPKAMSANLVVHGCSSGTGDMRDKLAFHDDIGMVTLKPLDVRFNEITYTYTAEQ